MKVLRAEGSGQCFLSSPNSLIGDMVLKFTSSPWLYCDFLNLLAYMEGERTMRTWKYGAIAALGVVCLLVLSSPLFALSLPLPMGVTLEGKGTVVSVEPGSAAERAGIQGGDRINRINGR